MKLRALATFALMLTVGNSAYAAIDAGNGASGDPELFLAVWDSSGNTSNTLLVDLGLGANSFDYGSSFNTSVDLSPLGIPGSDLSYAIVTGAQNTDPYAGIFFTSANELDPSSLFGGGDPANAINAVLANVTNLGDLVNSSAHNVGTVEEDLATLSTGGLGSIADGFNYGGFMVQEVGVAVIPNGAGLDTAMGFYNSIISLTSGTVESSRLAGNWLLSSGGLLSYSLGAAPIPLPAGVWLLGTALLGLVGVSRRRRTA